MAQTQEISRLRPTPRALKMARYVALGIAAAGTMLLALSEMIGPAVTNFRWTVEPVAYIGVILMVAGLGVAVGVFALAGRASAGEHGAAMRSWRTVTEDYFDTFSHDMGRPIRRILGKAREVRVRLEESKAGVPQSFIELLDEIEQQAPGFRLMLANVRVLVELEDPVIQARTEPLDAAAIVRNIVDRYRGIATDRGAEITWWAEPQEFGLVYGDASALDHVVTNLVDNAVKFANGHIEVRVTRNSTHYFVRVWDDGPGVQPSHVPHIFDRGWTPEVAARREKTSSGLGLFIARSLARRAGGDIACETSDDKGEGHHTAMTVMLPMASIGQQT